MASQADSFFIHSDFIRKDSSLRQDAAFVNGGVGQNFLQLVFQPGAVVDNRLAVAGLHQRNQFPDGIAAAAQVILQSLALDGAHGIIVAKCCLGYLHQVREQLLFVDFLPLHGKDIVHP